MMNIQYIIKTAKSLVAGGMELLAMDENTLTCNKRFAALGIPCIIEKNRLENIIAIINGVS
jgi:fructose-bisphosphate aldolase class I